MTKYESRVEDLIESGLFPCQARVQAAQEFNMLPSKDDIDLCNRVVELQEKE